MTVCSLYHTTPTLCTSLGSTRPELTIFCICKQPLKTPFQKQCQASMLKLLYDLCPCFSAITTFTVSALPLEDLFFTHTSPCSSSTNPTNNKVLVLQYPSAISSKPLPQYSSNKQSTTATVPIQQAMNYCYSTHPTSNELLLQYPSNKQ